MGAQNIPGYIKSTTVKTLVCKRNNKLLQSYGINKGQVVKLTDDRLHLVKFYDKDNKITHHVSLPTRLMKYFKEE